MTEMPPFDPESANQIVCPHCSIRVPAGVAVCPYCRQPLPADAAGKPKNLRRMLVSPERFPALRKQYREHGKWVKVVVPALLAVLVLWLAFGYMTRVRIVVPPDNAFLIEAETERKDGGVVLLKGRLTNRGDDVPDLSLRSIGVTAEFLHRDGKTENRRVFPKSPFRGEGALFREESGTFEIVVPKGVKVVTLRGEILNLGEDRVFVPSDRETGRLPAHRRR